jgi:hypothetical protein
MQPFNVWSAGYRLQAEELKLEAKRCGVRNQLFFSKAGVSLRRRLMRLLATNGFQIKFGIYQTEMGTDK